MGNGETRAAVLFDSSEPQALGVLEALERAASRLPAGFRSIDAAEAELEPCLGCFGCWIRTPGVCIHRNDRGAEFLGRIFDRDVLVIVSRITWGGYSPRIKSYADRMIPLLHPDFTKRFGEMHHRMRYRALPALLAAGYGAGTEPEEATFGRYTDAHRDNVGTRVPDGTFLWDAHERAGEDASSACSAWFTSILEKIRPGAGAPRRAASVSGSGTGCKEETV